jgi:acyl carrier protein
MASVEEKVKAIVAEKFKVPTDSLKAETSYFNDLGADSLDMNEVLMLLEEEFDLTFTDEDIDKINAIGTVGETVKYIEKNLEGETVK